MYLKNKLACERYDITSTIFMAALRIADAHIIFSSGGFSFFSSPNLSGRRMDVYHTSNWRGLRSEMYCTRLAGNAGRKKSPSQHHRTTFSGHIFANHVLTIGKLVKQQYLVHVYSKYGELRPTNG